MKGISFVLFVLIFFLANDVSAQKSDMNDLNMDSVMQVKDSLTRASRLAYKKSRQKQVNRDMPVISQDPDTFSHKLRCTNISRIGFMGIQTQYCATFNTAFILSKSHVYDVGIGTGIEYFNRGNDLISITQVPFYAMYNLYISDKLFLGLEPGIMVPVSGFYTSDLFGKVKEVDYKGDQFIPAFFYNLNVGFYMTEHTFLALTIRNQTAGVSYPINERKTMVGINIGIKL